MFKKDNERIMNIFALQSSGMFFPFNQRPYKNSGGERSMLASTALLTVA